MTYTKTFEELLKSMKKSYLGKEVPKQYKSKYGKIYNKKDIVKFGHSVAKSRGIKIDE